MVAIAAITLETRLAVFLQHHSPGEAFETIYLVGILVVSTVWGLGLSISTSLASVIALAYIGYWPGGHFGPFVVANGVTVVVFLLVALCTNFVAGRARVRAVEAEQRRREAEAVAVKLQESRDRLSELAEQQAALRQVATLVANAVDPPELFTAVAEEMRRCLRATTAGLWRYETSGEITLLAAGAEPALLTKLPPLGTRTPIDGDNIASRVLSTRRPARIDAYENAAGECAARLLKVGIRAAVGVPIIVDGRLWGHLAVASAAPGAMPADTEGRISAFADLVATAIANAATRGQLGELAGQQSALRRAATLVARGVDASELFKVVVEEMAQHLVAELAAVWRFESDRSAVLVVISGDADSLSVGSRMPLDGENLLAVVRESRSAARMDSSAIDNATGPAIARVREFGIRTAVGVPIIVDGRVWGASVVGSTRPEPLPADTEARLGDFADLVATALANAATRNELQTSRDQHADLAERQAALRRVATLVARGVDPSEVFHAVAEEIMRCLRVDIGAVWRFDSDGSVVLMAVSHPPGSRFVAVGERLTPEGDSAAARVWRTGAAARMDSFDSAVGQLGTRARADGVRSSVGAPVIVDGRMWGAAVAASYCLEHPPPDSEERIGDFADLVATALANAATRDELIASRARIVAAADDARRRLERDLHDGVQQRLVSLALQLRLAEGSAPPELQDLKAQLADSVAGLNAVSNELQQISRGIHPAILSKGGLGPALKTLARRCPVPVSLDVDLERRSPEPVEVAAYYVVAEALTNTAKYAHASAVNICVETNGANLLLSIQDDGIGGADIRKGSGLIGLKDRVEMLGGHMQIESHPGNGTSLHVTIPVEGTDG